MIMLAASLLLFTGVASAQHYGTALGARVGFFNGITVKHFIGGSNAIEGIGAFRWGGFALTGLYEWQKPFESVPGLDYFLGVGGHIGVWDNDRYYRYNHDRRAGNFTILGVDFIAGLEYTFREVPFNIGIDWKPAFNLVGDSHWWGDGAAISIRYVF